LDRELPLEDPPELPLDREPPLLFDGALNELLRLREELSEGVGTLQEREGEL
jgi:hypothetical protein